MPKKITAENAFYVLGAAVAGVILWNIYRTSQAAKANDDLVLDVGGVITDPNHWAGIAGEHYVPENQFVGAPRNWDPSNSSTLPVRANNVVLPHRYPPFSGTNLSALTVNGFQPLFRPSPRDFDYLEYAPPNQE